MSLPLHFYPPLSANRKTLPDTTLSVAASPFMSQSRGQTSSPGTLLAHSLSSALGVGTRGVDCLLAGSPCARRKEIVRV